MKYLFYIIFYSQGKELNIDQAIGSFREKIYSEPWRKDGTIFMSN